MTRAVRIAYVSTAGISPQGSLLYEQVKACNEARLEGKR
jgi:hypothetical protein